MRDTEDFNTHICIKIFTHCFMKKCNMREIEDAVDGKHYLRFYCA